MFIFMTDPKPTQRTAATKRGRSRIPHNVMLRVSVAGIEPEIWRRVRVPDNYTLHQLHRVFQLLFGWQDYHLYEFRIGERRFEEPLPDAEGEPSTRFRLRDFELNAGDRFIYTYDFGDNWEHDVVVEECPPWKESGMSSSFRHCSVASARGRARTRADRQATARW